MPHPVAREKGGKQGVIPRAASVHPLYTPIVMVG